MSDANRIFAAVDVGSHSVKLRLARRTGADTWRPLTDQVVITGLGRGLSGSGRLDPTGVQRTLTALEDFADLARSHGVAAMAAVGTMALRQAVDGREFRDRATVVLGTPLEIISGDEEARLTYLGAVSSLPRPPERATQLVFDIGGASTELAWGHERLPADRRSLALGTITLTESHGLAGRVNPATRAAALRVATCVLASLPVMETPTRLVGVGATPASLIALTLGRDVADGEEVHGMTLEAADLQRWLAILSDLAADERRALPGLHPGRAEVILAGAVITAALAHRWRGVPLVISGCGLRQGLLVDRFTD